MEIDSPCHTALCERAIGLLPCQHSFQGAVMLIIGVAMIIVGSCCSYIDNWIGYLLAFVMAAGVLVTCSTVIMRAIDFAIYS